MYTTYTQCDGLYVTNIPTKIIVNVLIEYTLEVHVNRYSLETGKLFHIVINYLNLLCVD